MQTTEVLNEQIGTKNINGTDFPVCNVLQRQTNGKRVVWIVQRWLCNGVPLLGSLSFDNKREALGFLYA